MPALILQIMQYIQLAVTAAPSVIKVYEDGKALIESLFKSGLITAEQQNGLMAWADQHMEATLKGEVPPELTVE